MWKDWDFAQQAGARQTRSQWHQFVYHEQDLCYPFPIHACFELLRQKNLLSEHESWSVT
jgi:hypothetical protein